MTVDVLVPTFRRPAALAMTLTAIAGQSHAPARVVIADQTEAGAALHSGEVKAVLRVLRARGVEVDAHVRERRHGVAEQRQFLLERSTAPLALFVDDDVLLEPWVIEVLCRTIERERCGFVGSAMIGLSKLDDHRPAEQHIEFWSGGVEPERVVAGTPAWERWRLHNAANLFHVQQRLAITPDRARVYRVAWVAGCVLYDARKLREVGGFSFWRALPANHCGEDVLAQLRVMARFGGCGVIPSGAYHLELPTTIPDRSAPADRVLGWSD